LIMNNEQQNRYFRHFKGGLYKLLYEARDSETRKEVVVYQALYGERGIWVRPKKMFFENISRDGYKGSRFREITKEEAFPYSELPICSHLKK